MLEALFLPVYTRAALDLWRCWKIHCFRCLTLFMFRLCTAVLQIRLMSQLCERRQRSEENAVQKCVTGEERVPLVTLRSFQTFWQNMNTYLVYQHTFRMHLKEHRIMLFMSAIICKEWRRSIRALSLTFLTKGRKRNILSS